MTDADGGAVTGTAGLRPRRAGASTGADNLSRPPVGMTWQRSQIPYCPCRACRFRGSPSPPPPSTICRMDLEPDQARRVLGRRGGLSRRVRAAESAICSCIRAGSGPNAAASTLHSGGSREDVARYLHPTTWGAAPVRRVTAWARTSVVVHDRQPNVRRIQAAQVPEERETSSGSRRLEVLVIVERVHSHSVTRPN